ncbi:uncharacterized protein TrAFT101_009815 [Trichoderma asperellum]|uniref:uncharacterized protein n=1 Tax=Trichoderma asperellum TaxID=101201 RepID=UPI003333D59A|nr:hypothetical protein TrAFT101_009815 [Trichoderma asperellum]
MTGLQNAQPSYQPGLNRTLAASCRLNWIHAGANTTICLHPHGVRWPEGAAENRSATTRKDFGKAWLWEQFALFLETQKPGVSPSAHHIHVEAHAGEDREIASLFGSVGSPAADGRAV